MGLVIEPESLACEVNNLRSCLVVVQARYQITLKLLFIIHVFFCSRDDEKIYAGAKLKDTF